MAPVNPESPITVRIASQFVERGLAVSHSCNPAIGCAHSASTWLRKLALEIADRLGGVDPAEF
jgi:hypothetical protein